MGNSTSHFAVSDHLTLRFALWAAFCPAFAFIGLSDAHAVTPAKTNSKSLAEAGESTKATSKNSNKPDKVDHKSEQTAMELVGEHLPELRNLLENLKNDHPRQYDAAIRDLVKSARRLDSIKKRDEELFEIEVEMLKTQSSVKLLTAKLKVRDDESDRDLLRKAVQRLHEAELMKAQYTVRYLTERFQKAEQQLATAKRRLDGISKASESRIEKTYLGFLKNAGRQPEKTPKRKKQ